jgi:hypothetical protein
MRQVNNQICDSIVQQDKHVDYRSLDRSPNEVNDSNSRDGIRKTVLRCINDDAAEESGGIAEWLDFRHFHSTPLVIVAAMAAALKQIILNSDKKLVEKVGAVNRFGSVPNKSIAKWLDQVNLSFAQFKELASIVDIKIGKGNQKRDWTNVFHHIELNLSRIDDALKPKGTIEVNTTTFTSPKGYMNFFLNPPIGSQGAGESLIEVFSYPLIAMAQFQRSSNNEFETWRSFLNAAVAEEFKWFDIAMLLVSPEIGRKMLDGETTPWNEALEMLTPYIVKFDREGRMLFMNLLHCAGFEGKGLDGFERDAFLSYKGGKVSLPNVIDFQNPSLLKIGGWAIDTNNFNFLLEASKFLAKSASKRPREEVPTFVEKQPVSAPKRRKVPEPKKVPKENNSAIWLLGGAVVLTFAFIR